jgi:acetyl-CoA carboxylase biotin carboxyl carrier protein
MDLSYLKKLIRIVEHSSVDEIEVEEEGLRVRVAKSTNHNSAGAAAQTGPQIALAPSAQTQPAAGAPSAPAQQAPAEPIYHEIKSPIVGTFYRSPAPDAESYVEVGQIVQPKQVLCIIEAMKLMNEIESDVAGRIVKINVDNGKPVEYNQVLFLLEPA